MTTLPSLRRSFVAVLLLLALVLQGTTAVLAGTTGAVNGTVSDASTGKPIGGASVSVQSPTQSASTTTDATGRFSFLSLIPDTYTVSAAATQTYDASSVSGVLVTADATQSVSISQPTKLKVIGSVTSRAASSLVKPGTTADVYSIGATQQSKVATIGGGGNLNSAWSAIATVPGVYIAPNQSGYIGASSTISIRGGDYDQIGYELDGVPVNRAFDNYPSGAASSLGQQELQVYTGANPANSEAQGISGYINQVIRTGSYPATRNLDLAAGAPIFYNKYAFETGGANPARTFSYYLGLGGYNQNFRYYDQYNGASLVNVAGGPLTNCPNGAPAALVPSCVTANGTPYSNVGGTFGPGSAYVLGPFNLNLTSGITDRDSIVNLHFGIPRKDGNRDDVQVLYDNNHINTRFYTSTNDQGGPDFLANAGVGIPSWSDGYSYGGPVGVPYQPGYAAFVQRYLYPNSPTGRLTGGACGGDTGFVVNSGCVPLGQRDSISNNQGIFKLQYQRNFGTSAFLRVYGYTYYSDWLQADPQTAFFNYLGPGAPDYELSSHTRGISATFTDQITSQHLISLQGSYTTATTTRDNNTQMFNGGGLGSRSYFLATTDASNGANGLCYTAPGETGVATPTTCLLGGGAQFFTYRDAATGVIPAPSGTCGGTPCRFLVVGNGLAATYNRVKPKFSSFSITDQWKPSDRLNLNLGLRLDRFEFDGSDTTNSPARAFWYTAFNLDNCLGPQNLFFDKTTLRNPATGVALTPTDPCPAGYTAANVQNIPSQVEQYNELQPRLGFTYTVDPRTVIRGSYGRYTQAPNSAFQQYDALQPNAPFLLYTTYNFQQLGFTTPGHQVRPPTSNNYDLSYEHQFNGDVAVKLTPFLRKTQDQIQQFFLNQQTNFVSGVNVGKQTSQGFELEVDKGDFSRNGLAARISFTYTNSYINYTKTASGLSVLDPINAQIQNYNAYTSFCATHASDSRCGTTQSGNAAAPCYTTAGAADAACATGSIANPYWNAPVQALQNPNANYATYDIFPNGIGSSYDSFGAPYVLTAIVNYKRGGFAITPALQFIAGQRYGAPMSTPGILPDLCTGGGTAIDQGRYPYGAPGGTGFDPATCGTGTPNGTFGIPNPFTRQFDPIGSFRSPSNLLLHLQASYDVNKRITLVGNFANVISRCFGGTPAPWTRTNACNYTGYFAGTFPTGNVYDPSLPVQPYTRYPYLASFPQTPFNMFVEARIKL